MRINRFYTNQRLNAGDDLLLDDAASHHLVKVLRFKPGTRLMLFNGDGADYPAEFIAAEKKRARVSVLEKNIISCESPFAIHLGIGISKGDRMDWVMQKSTEMGVTEITPVFSEFSDLKLKAERLEKKMRHWYQVIISACEQSGRSVLPALNPAITIDVFARDATAYKWILHPGEPTLKLPAECPPSASLLVGPEGGFSDREVALAKEHGFISAALGPRVLRTETAPLAALSVLQYAFGDFQ